jgi:DNA ligase-1
MEELDPNSSYVPDGEFVYIDPKGREDFSKTGILTKDDFTDLSKNIKFVIFYLLDDSEFESGVHTSNFCALYNRSLKVLGVEEFAEPINGLYKTKYPNIYLVAQHSDNLYDELHKEYIEKGWEGLMMLDSSAKYQHKRTKSLQKIKAMKDSEFVIIGANLGKGRFSEILGYLTIELPNGDKVDVGSGFTDEQRDQLWQRRNQITNGLYYATVQYFEETKDSSGKSSLRFPVFKGLRNCVGEEL